MILVGSKMRPLVCGPSCVRVTMPHRYVSVNKRGFKVA